jgi:hypothetical protein
MPCITVLLGAGASRGVKYAHLGEFPSPLDGDFFDLLQRLKPQTKDIEAVNFVLDQASRLPPDFRSSMERTFYTLHLRAYLKRKLSGSDDESEEAKIIGSFAHATAALLRASHGQLSCDYHKAIIEKLTGDNAVVSFNYDLVIERALRPFAVARRIPFGGHIYGFENSSNKYQGIPKVLKLHGSSNWQLSQDGFSTGDSWEEFDLRPWYLRYKAGGTEFPIFLPFWDKDIARGPWLHLWRQAYQQLQHSEVIIVWGYSLPPTDVKARELFSIAVAGSGVGVKLCVIDPSVSARQRWRDLYPRAQFWEYDRITDFLQFPPKWWSQLPIAEVYKRIKNPAAEN